MASMLTPACDPALFFPLALHRRQAPLLAYGVDEARLAWDDWGANCGPWALAAVLGIPLEAVRPLLPKFAQRPYTKEADIRAALTAAGRGFCERQEGWPAFGLVRVLWHGPWWDDADPFARRRHSHWVATVDAPGGRLLFDGNAIAEGGWMPAQTWVDIWAPWIAEHYVPSATGAWRALERFEVVGAPAR